MLDLSRLNILLFLLVSSLQYHGKPVQACKERVIHDHEFELIKTTKTAIITHRERILLTARILYSFRDIAHILLPHTIIVMVFAQFLQFFYNIRHIRAYVLPKYIFIYYWMTYVTATSGGYGKCVPSTKISKSIDMCLMMTGMILICINSINIIKHFRCFSFTFAK